MPSGLDQMTALRQEADRTAALLAAVTPTSHGEAVHALAHAERSLGAMRAALATLVAVYRRVCEGPA